MLQVKDYAKTVQQPKDSVQHTRSSAKGSIKNKSGYEEKPSETGRGFFSILAIFILIAVLFAAYRQYTRHKAIGHPAPQETQAQTQKTTSPQFDFYTVLPSGSTPGAQNSTNSQAVTNTATPVVTTSTDTVASATPATASSAAATTAPVQTINTNSPSTPAQSNPQFYLNAGDFANSADAEQMLSQLLLLGVQANIKTVQGNGAIAYEVLVGPYADQDAMNIVKSQLAAHQIEAAVVQD